MKKKHQFRAVLFGQQAFEAGSICLMLMAEAFAIHPGSAGNARASGVLQ
jgi:hypothetical protein